MTENFLEKVQDRNKLVLSLDLAKDVITKDYLYKLSGYEVAEMPEELKKIDITEYTRLYRFTRFASDKKESVIDKLVTVLNAAYSSNATVVALICGHKTVTEYYLGVVSKDIQQSGENIETQGEILKGALTGNFPGLKIEPVKGGAKARLLERALSSEYVTAISGLASVRNEKEHSYEKFVQGIEHLVDALQGREYHVVVIADSVSAGEIAAAKSGYEGLYTQLSPFLKTTASFHESESVTVTQAHTDGFTESIGESVSLTQNYSQTSGWSESSSHGTNKSKNEGGMIGTAVGAVLGTFLGDGILGAMVGGSIGGGLIGSSGENISQTTTTNASTTQSSGKTTSQNSSKATQNSDTYSEAEGETHGKTMQFSNENKTVKNLLGVIDRHMERLQSCEAYGAFQCATYVLSPDPETNAIVSSGYHALMRGDSSSLQVSHINNWSGNSAGGQKVKEYLARLSHPLFLSPMQTDVRLSPASLSNAYELAVNIGLPKKSINGLPVFEMASFGRNVFETTVADASVSQIKLGAIYHMGAVQDTAVNLDIKSLAMHTFITGSTGSGKSNTVYQMLRELQKEGVHYLVIEPAKGEYKHIFGNSEAEVYGINPYVSPLLKLNPFKFPEGIHVLEHIDRLIEIFNVCWPMYAAMPAVLKDAVERAYVNAGWDLADSVNQYTDKLFPTFSDVLEELTNVVTESAFSQEVRDNYIGSLATRVKSLTNGIYGRIFDNNELGDEKLFDENVIVDLSRVGSVETKSMIMGLLVMRLQEYRMTSAKMNAALNHVTVLEEAHNLLKRTSTEQSSESSNLLGKSVEMLSNAIAEVRTYGEGFIIADQAPGLLDMSVIRNTNTKIIMRLPDAEDRNLAGKSANLSDEQIKELAKLPTGVAAVYQNDWLEPVLCRVHYEKTEHTYQPKQQEKNEALEEAEKKQELVECLLNKTAGERLDFNMEELVEKIAEIPLRTKIKAEAVGLLRSNGVVDLSDISTVIYELVCTPEAEAKAEAAENLEDWKNAFVYADNSIVSEFSTEKQNAVVECILREQIVRYDKPDEYLETWYRFVKGEVV